MVFRDAVRRTAAYGQELTAPVQVRAATAGHLLRVLRLTHGASPILVTRSLTKAAAPEEREVCHFSNRGPQGTRGSARSSCASTRRLERARVPFCGRWAGSRRGGFPSVFRAERPWREQPVWPARLQSRGRHRAGGGLEDREIVRRATGARAPGSRCPRRAL